MTARAPLALLLLTVCHLAAAAPNPDSAPAVATAAGSATAAAATSAAGAPAPELLAPAPAPETPGELAAIGQQSLRVVDWAASRTQDLLATALSSIGVKYRRGASDPSVGFDCSGFVMHVYKEALGMLLPHNAYSMSLQGKPVAAADLKPGDLVFFNTLKHQFSHVGIYLGDDRFIHAPSHGKTVQVDKLSDSYWVRHFNGARRIDPASSAKVASDSVPPPN
ncbi:MAG: C40 family peptidase [Pseudomonadota bacterium]|nr:C40 family peptidase [Pseudomonadota bacterium]